MIRKLAGAALLAGGGYLVWSAVSGRTPGLPLPRGSWRVTSGFGPRTSPTTGDPNSFHYGIDLAAPEGTPIFAVTSGEVIRTSSTGSGGISASIQTGSKAYTYHHMSRRIVKTGDRVNRGDTIGYVGSTGSSTGNHLHLEIVNSSGEHIDPLTLIPRLAA